MRQHAGLMAILALLRHGESDAGHSKRFAGWADVGLSEEGRHQARSAGAAIAASGIRFDRFHSSLLSRAQDTMTIVRDQLPPDPVETESSWLLNERHYGVLQGCDRREMVAAYGEAAVVAWRRDYRARPPLLGADDPRHPRHDPRYANIDARLLPAAESLEDAALRVIPWWETRIAPHLQAGANVLVVAHTASVRGLTRLIEQLDDATTAAFRIATCSPVFYEFDGALRLLRKFEPVPDRALRWRRLRSKLKPTRMLPWM